MPRRKEVPDVHIFSTQSGDVVIRPDLNCYLLLPSLPTSAWAELRPLHPSLCGGKHYFSSRWHKSTYVIKGNAFTETQDLSIAPSRPARPLHPSCCGGQHYFVTADGFFVIILNLGTITAVKDLATGEPAEGLDPPGHRQWSREKMGGVCSYLYCLLWDNFSGGFFSLNLNILSFLPGGLGLTLGPAFGAWELVIIFHNSSDAPATKVHRICRKVGCAREKLAAIGHSWRVSVLASLELSCVITELAKAQFALPVQYGGTDCETEQEEWEEAHEAEEALTLTLQPKEAAYVWQYRLGLGKEAILFCQELKVTYSSVPPSEPPLPSSP